MQIFTLVIVVLVIIVIGLLAAWNTVMKTTPKYSTISGWSKAGFGMRCSLTPSANLTNDPSEYSSQDCEQGLECVLTGSSPTEGFCLKKIGVSCRTLSECVDTAIVCNGVCSTVNNGGLGTSCGSNSNCSSGTTCDTLKDSPVCVNGIGGNCATNDNCVTGTVCTDSVCIVPSGEGSSCNVDSECDTDLLCNNGFCQKPDITTGQTGASCYMWQDPLHPVVPGSLSSLVTTNLGTKLVPRCETGLVCTTTTDFIASLGFGTCQISGPWNGSCSENSGCPVPSLCGPTGRCVFPEDNTSSKITFKPLSCSSTNSVGLCLTNFKCESNTCKSFSNGPVLSQSQCASGKTMTVNYSILGMRFNRGEETPSNPLSSESWQSLGSNVTVDYSDTTISARESSSGVDVLIHIRNSSILKIYNSNGGVTTYTVNSVLTNAGNVHRVGFTLGGNYYCIIVYSTYSSIYTSSSPTFTGLTKLTTAHTYTGSGSPVNLPKYIYWASVDDRTLTGYSTRISLVANTTPPLDARKLYGGTMFIGSLSNLSIVSSIANVTWCTNVMTSDMDVATAASSYLYCRLNGSSLQSYSLTGNMGVLAPYTPVINRVVVDMIVQSSLNINSYNLPIYTLVNHIDSPEVSDSQVLELTRGYYDFVIPANVDTSTPIAVTYPSSSLDTSDYSPMLIILSRVCA